MLILFLGEIKFTYLKKPYIVTCTTYQMAILLLFNENEKMTYKYAYEILIKVTVVRQGCVILNVSQTCLD